MAQRNTDKRHIVATFILGIFTGIVLVALFVSNRNGSWLPRTEHTMLAVTEDEDFTDDFENKGKWYGLCDKNSTHSVEDFRKAVASDPVLKTHFADFRWENARMGRLEKATLAYVHFRREDIIFRKIRPITLPAGDVYITDGNTKVRTHCCNSFSEAPPLLESAETVAQDGSPPAGMPQLPPEALYQDLPGNSTVPPGTTAGTTLLSPAGTPSSSPTPLVGPLALLIPDKGDSDKSPDNSVPKTPDSPSPSDKTTSVPEPGLFLLAITGTGGLLFAARLRKRTRKSGGH
jgi:hypothetical protein